MRKTALLLILLTLASCEKKDISGVKNQVFNFLDSSVTFGEAVDNYKFFEDVEYKAVKDEQGRRYVNVFGYVDLKKFASIFKDGKEHVVFVYTNDKNKTVSYRIKDLSKLGVIFQFVYSKSYDRYLPSGFWVIVVPKKGKEEIVSPTQFVFSELQEATFIQTVYKYANVIQWFKGNLNFFLISVIDIYQQRPLLLFALAKQK